MICDQSSSLNHSGFLLAVRADRFKKCLGLVRDQLLTLPHAHAGGIQIVLRTAQPQALHAPRAGGPGRPCFCRTSRSRHPDKSGGDAMAFDGVAEILRLFFPRQPLIHRERYVLPDFGGRVKMMIRTGYRHAGQPWRNTPQACQFPAWLEVDAGSSVPSLRLVKRSALRTGEKR